MTITFVPAYVPVLMTMLFGGGIFSLLTIGAALTYRFAGDEAVLDGAKLYAGVSAIFIGAAVIIAGLPYGLTL